MNSNKFNFKKKYGQNFISDKNLINKIVNSANIDNNTLVIEIGPGNGALTVELLKKCMHLIIYEIDVELEGVLKEKLKYYHNYDIYFKDFLKADLKEDMKNINYKRIVIVSNLPYYITTQIIKRIIDSNVVVDEMVLMLQKEVADRLSASPKSREYGYMTVLLNYYFDIKKLFVVKKDMFIPRPEVDSCVIKLQRKHNKILLSDTNKFINLIQQSFKFKRKTLRNNLKGLDLVAIEQSLSKYNLSLNNRAEDVPLDAFIDIANNL